MIVRKISTDGEEKSSGMGLGLVENEDRMEKKLMTARYTDF